MHEVQPRQHEVPDYSPYSRSSYLDSHLVENEHIENLRSSHFGLSRRATSPETISLEPNSYKVSAADDLELNSPSSIVSSLCQDQDAKVNKIEDQDLQEQEEDEVMSSYVIEINSDHREGRGEALGIDEAIAWAKEKFQTHREESAESEGNFFF